MINTEISKRVVTAVLLAGVTVAAIFLLESFVFAIVIGLIAAGAAWEWCHLDRKMDPLGWEFVGREHWPRHKQERAGTKINRTVRREGPEFSQDKK